MYGLVLSGGKSSRMQQDKGALIFQGQTLRDRTFKNLDTICKHVFYSLRDDQLLEPNLRKLDRDQIILDQLLDIGPAAALLAAHEKFPTENWFIVACDFPLATPECFLNLAEHFSVASSDNEVICYSHPDGTPEPLLAVWRPSALDRLKKSVQNQITGPLHTLRKSNPLILAPHKSEWLTNTNTPDEWDAVKKIQ
ncbi:MAG: molybdenum cofactor guanylyltransferase [Bdellovibrio sp.]|nr:molybdenum cofactor guanylyltransferase [Bdellovibrio sp.]